MPDFIYKILGDDFVFGWEHASLLGLFAATILAFAWNFKIPKRPSPDPLADTEFEENGAVKRNRP